MSEPYRPLVAVVAYHLDGTRVSRWPDGGFGVPVPYVERLRAAGARTAILAPGEVGAPEELLEPFDALVLVGGGDIDPSRYGAEPDLEHNYGVEPDRDAFEIDLLLAADRLAMPTLAICRGMQLMNVAFGGTLHQHLPDRPGLLEHGLPIRDTQTMHDVSVEPQTRLSATTEASTLRCSSHHHQGVDQVGSGLMVTGRSPDGLVEAIERIVDDPQDEGQTWMLGIQWHPEDTAAVDPAQRSLFEALVLIGHWRGIRARPGESEGRSRAYALVPHDREWAGRFVEEADRIARALPHGLVSRIDHVGSTAIPGLAAKPIVDIQLSLASLSPRAPYVEPLTSLGYLHVLDPWADDHEYFARDVDGTRMFQIHACLAGSEWERRHLGFRDWLLEHPDDAVAYEELKRELADAHPRDLARYVEGKSPFIRSIETKARGVPAA
ncbi:MAG: gamma-glutamyl-gamma-aminobutyrate hydrolase family protein [Actinomycetota bacterium]